jgi:hypothetical protein
MVHTTTKTAFDWRMGLLLAAAIVLAGMPQNLRRKRQFRLGSERIRCVTHKPGKSLRNCKRCWTNWEPGRRC